MVHFRTKNPNLGVFWRALEWKMFVYFIVICNILHLCRIFYGYLVYFVVIRYIFLFWSAVLWKSGNLDQNWLMKLTQGVAFWCRAIKFRKNWKFCNHSSQPPQDLDSHRRWYPSSVRLGQFNWCCQRFHFYNFPFDVLPFAISDFGQKKTVSPAQAGRQHNFGGHITASDAGLEVLCWKGKNGRNKSEETWDRCYNF
jgi:hypothetical protein